MLVVVFNWETTSDCKIRLAFLCYYETVTYLTKKTRLCDLIL